jgi:hypothetical protein
MLIILATQEAEIRRIAVQRQPGQIVCEILSQKTLSQKIGLVKWFVVKALSLSLSTAKTTTTTTTTTNSGLCAACQNTTYDSFKNIPVYKMYLSCMFIYVCIYMCVLYLK